MLSFLGGGTTWGWGAWEEELCGDFLSRYGKGGYEEKSPIYGELRALVWGKLPAGSLGG
ncbi:hypothetical protein [Bartonella sp. AA56HLJMS]|uniref:hypothetical protein n=1 Tax=Bartonella sp. AA56HLJMS TaxID=3243434 RepID=UPI0035D0C3EE